MSQYLFVLFVALLVSMFVALFVVQLDPWVLTTLRWLALLLCVALVSGCGGGSALVEMVTPRVVIVGGAVRWCGRAPTGLAWRARQVIQWSLVMLVCSDVRGTLAAVG